EPGRAQARDGGVEGRAGHELGEVEAPAGRPERGGRGAESAGRGRDRELVGVLRADAPRVGVLVELGVPPEEVEIEAERAAAAHPAVETAPTERAHVRPEQALPVEPLEPDLLPERVGPARERELE